MSRRTSKKDREEFVAILVRECPQVDPLRVARAAGRIMRHSATIGRLVEESCNGHPAQGSPTIPIERLNKLQDAWDARIERQDAAAQKHIIAACSELGLVPDFGGDPRGYTVKIKLPSGRYNTMGGKEDGWGVPTS